jgi:hypothetical protein
LTFPTNITYAFFSSSSPPIRATCHSHLILPYLSILIMLGEEYKLRSSLLCSLPQPPFNSFSSVQIFSSAPFSQTLSVCVPNFQKPSFSPIQKKIPWSESASELYRPGDRRLSAKWLPTCADRRCHVVSVTDPCGRNLGFLDRSRYFSIK